LKILVPIISFMKSLKNKSRFLLVFFFIFGAELLHASGVPGNSVKGGIPRLIKTVVNVVVSDKNFPDEYRGESADGKESSDGSGFIIDENGYIVTNCHVIDSADKIKIVLYDGSECIARVIGRDERSDIALLKIDVDVKLPFVLFADSDKVEVGDPVIAIGNPFGFGQTVTSGIVSFKGRNLSSQIAELGAGGDLVSYLQTDAAVNKGNSGGPLFTYNGEVVGMITVFFSDGVQSTGINFAIPSNTLIKVIKELREHGKMQRSWLGFVTIPLKENVARALGIKEQAYVVISKIEANSPASTAGLRIGDIVSSVNNEIISRKTSPDFMQSLPIGKVVPIQIVRDGREMKFSIMVGTRNDDEPSFYADAEKTEIPYEKINEIGIGVTDLTQNLRKNFDISDSVNGVMISYLGSLQGNDLNIGNVIITVNQINIFTVEDLKTQLHELRHRGRKEIALYIYDPQTRRSDYTVLSLHPASVLPNSKILPRVTKPSVAKPSANKNHPTDDKKSIVKELEGKLEDFIKTKWRLI
jgi:serine protease Do